MAEDGFNINTGATAETTETGFMGVKKTVLVEDMNLRGIDATKIPDTQSAIDKYIINISGVLREINMVTSNNVQTALKGKVQEDKVTSYINESVRQIQSIVDFFNKFSTDLKTIEANYISQTQNINTDAVKSKEEASGVSEADNLTGVQPFN